MVKNELTGEWRASSAAYSPTNDGMVSVDIEQLLTNDGLDVLAMYPALDRNVAAAAHSFAQLKAQNLDLKHDPIGHNWYHGSITGKFTKGVKNNLVSSIEYLIPIDPVEAQRLKDESGRP